MIKQISYYIISHIYDLEFSLNIAENWAAINNLNSINQSLNIFCGLDNVDIEKVDIKPNDIVIKSSLFPQDSKCMISSEDYKRLLEEALEKLNAKKTRAKKTTIEKRAKPRAKKHH